MLANLLKRWSGRPGSNRRRPAWEVGRRLEIKTIAFSNVTFGHVKTRSFFEQFSAVVR
jgi:hypothetical protein